MAVETDFSFAQEIPGLAVAGVGPPPDLLGLLRPFVGKPAGGKDAKRSWKGTGFNMIWRPNFGGEFGPTDFFLQLNLTDEQLDFTEITGTGIANRSLFEKTVVLGGAAYTQAIKDSFDQSGQHFEPGVWANVPAIANPAEPPTVVRMGSIPHGTTINLQGVAFQVGQPIFETSSITPFRIGSPDDGQTDLVHFAEEDFTKDSPSRTDRVRVASLTPEQFKNPNLFLSEAIAKQKIVKTTVLRIVVRRSGSGDQTTSPRRRWRRGEYRVSRRTGRPAYRRPNAVRATRSPPRSGSKNSPTGVGSSQIYAARAAQFQRAELAARHGRNASAGLAFPERARRRERTRPPARRAASAALVSWRATVAPALCRLPSPDPTSGRGFLRSCAWFSSKCCAMCLVPSMAPLAAHCVMSDPKWLMPI